MSRGEAPTLTGPARKVPELTAQADTGLLQRVVVQDVLDAFGSTESITAQWRDLGYHGAPDLARAAAEQRVFCDLLTRRGAEVVYLPAAAGTSLDSLYVRDASVLCDRGAILCRMGKPARRSEPAAQRQLFEALNIPILGQIENPGTLEGGDIAWLDQRTVAVGLGYRTNREGIRQLHGLLGDAVDEVIEVPLPHFRGPSDVFHLMSILSPIDRDLALVHSPLMPVVFRQALLGRGIELVEVPTEELDSLGCNSLAIAPRVCLLARGNPITRDRLVAAGTEVLEFPGGDLCVKGGGGPTCLTRPLAWST